LENLKQELIKETKIWLWYAAISTVAGIFGYCALIDRFYGSWHTDADVNVLGMLLKPIWTYLVPFLCVFSVFSAIRIGIVCLSKAACQVTNIVNGFSQTSIRHCSCFHLGFVACTIHPAANKEDSDFEPGGSTRSRISISSYLHYYDCCRCVYPSVAFAEHLSQWSNRITVRWRFH
jgi:hypothetical protein